MLMPLFAQLSSPLEITWDVPSHVKRKLLLNCIEHLLCFKCLKYIYLKKKQKKPCTCQYETKAHLSVLKVLFLNTLLSTFLKSAFVMLLFMMSFTIPMGKFCYNEFY